MQNHEQWQNFCYNVRELRMREGLSLTRMAGIMGITRKTLCSIEAGVIPPRTSSSVLFRIHKDFGISPRELVVRRL